MKNYWNRLISSLYLIPFALLLSDALVLDRAFALGTGYGKEMWFYIMLAPTLLATVLCFIQRRQSLRHNAIDIWVLALAFIAGGFTYLALPIWQMKTPTLLLLIVAYYCFRVFIVQRRSHLPLLLMIWMTTGLIQAGWGLLQLYGITPSQHNLFATTGSFFNPGPYAGYLAMVFPTALYYVLRDKKLFKNPWHKRKSLFYIRWGIALSTLVLTILVLPATMSRAAWVAVIIGSIAVYIQLRLRRRLRDFYFPYHWKKYRKQLIRWGTVASLLLITMLSLLYFVKKDSADGRMMIWKISLSMLTEQQIQGYGIGCFGGYYGEAQANYMNAGKASEQEMLLAGEPMYAFNEFIQLYIELGLIAFLIAMGIFGWALYTGMRRRQIAPVASLLALLTFASMSYPFSLMPFLIALAFLIAACVSKPYVFVHHPLWYIKHDFKHHIRHRWNTIWIIVILTTCTAVYTYIFWNRIPVYKAYKSWYEARPLYHSGAYKQTADAYKKIAPYLPTEVEFLFEYGQALSNIKEYGESNQVLDQAARYSSDPMIYVIKGKNSMNWGFAEDGKESFKKAINRVPHKLYPHYAWAKASFERQEWEQAEREAKNVLQKTPKVESPATNEMKREMKKLIEQIEIEKQKKDDEPIETK